MTVPCPAMLYELMDSGKYSEEPLDDPAINLQTEGGWTITRPRFTKRPPVVFSVGYTDLSNPEKEEIELLYINTRGGSEIITGFVHPIRGSLSVRFKPGVKPKYTYKGAGINYRWNVTIQLEEIA